MKLVTISCFGIFVVLTPLHCRCNAFGSACPEIITRKEWNSRNVTTLEPSLRPSPYVIIHHSAGKECFDLEECYSRVRGIQDKHMDGRNWSDIGYNFLIGSDGRIYEGRGWGKIGAHARGWNTNSVGICFMGMFT
ncbi:putative peptidoglycan-recognition protein, partial [Trypoxylus dichotomus]